MKCTYHPAHELTARIERTPVFAAQSSEATVHNLRGTRAILRCPVPGCPTVASTQDQPEQARICSNCKDPIYGEAATYASRDICKPCRIELQAKRRLIDMRRKRALQVQMRPFFAATGGN